MREKNSPTAIMKCRESRFFFIRKKKLRQFTFLQIGWNSCAKRQFKVWNRIKSLQQTYNLIHGDSSNAHEWILEIWADLSGENERLWVKMMSAN